MRVKLSGSSSVSGPGGEYIEAKVHLYSEPMGGTLTGAAVMTGNMTSELETNKGHYMADMLLKPIVQQFKPPPAEGAQADAMEGDAESAVVPEADVASAEPDVTVPHNGEKVQFVNGDVGPADEVKDSDIADLI